MSWFQHHAQRPHIGRRLDHYARHRYCISYHRFYCLNRNRYCSWYRNCDLYSCKHRLLCIKTDHRERCAWTDQWYAYCMYRWYYAPHGCNQRWCKLDKQQHSGSYDQCVRRCNGRKHRYYECDLLDYYRLSRNGNSYSSVLPCSTGSWWHSKWHSDLAYRLKRERSSRGVS